MSSIRNPFQTLYVTERVNELDFPAIFSPTLIPLVLPLFQPGNVMLSGTQGTGKSMLLALLDTQIRLAFWADESNSYPVEPEFCKFVGANINLSASKVLKFNERKFSDEPEENVARSKAVFADYFNCWIVRDLFYSIQTLQSKASKDRLRECGVNSSVKSLNSAVSALAQSEELAGLIPSAKNVEDAIKLLSSRLRCFLDFINFKIDEIPKTIWSSITGIGEPISKTMEVLKKAKVLAPTTEVFVTVDQCEELLRLEQADLEKDYGRFRLVLDKLISSREKGVSYRLGTRPNAVWKGKSEEGRDYVRVDLDTIFKKTEHLRSLFPRFANDVFCRRLALNDEPIDDATDAINEFFGTSPTASKRAQACAPAKKPERTLRLGKEWPKNITEMFESLASENVLSAKLGAALYRQTIARLDKGTSTPEKERARSERELAEFNDGQQPWANKDRQWWRKERTGQAILQIASANSQRVPHFGKRDVLALSGKNILVFASICQRIWENWIQQTNANSEETHVPRPFGHWQQDQGIRAASETWHRKISSAPNGDTVLRLIDELGNRLYQQLRDDNPMSYPGANGISLKNVELEDEPEIRELFNLATAEGFLQETTHTSKSSSRNASTKWYTHPILAPYYKLTVAHTKEPLYLSISKLRGWLEKAKVLEPIAKPKTPTKKLQGEKQASLFDSEGEE